MLEKRKILKNVYPVILAVNAKDPKTLILG